MKNKRVGFVIAALIFVLIIAGCSRSESSTSSNTSSSSSERVKTTRINLDMPVPLSSSWGVAAETFASEINERSGGRYEVRIFPDSQLAGGSQSKALEMLQAGDIDVTLHGVLTWASGDVRIGMPSMPWLFSSWEDAEEKMNGEAGNLIKEIVEETGAHALAFGISGFRQLFNNVRPVSSPEDLYGIKIRVPGNPIYVDLFKLLGADPVTMNASELYTALAQGAVDGQENPADMTITQKFCEVVKYMTVWNYSCEPIILSVSQRLWSSLSDEDKAMFEEAALVACQAQVEAAKERDSGYMDQLLNEFNIEPTYLTDEQLEAFKVAATPIYDTYRNVMGEELYSAFGVE